MLKHNLSPGVVVPLAQNIYHNIEQVLRDREEQGNQDRLIDIQQDKRPFEQTIDNERLFKYNKYRFYPYK